MEGITTAPVVANVTVSLTVEEAFQLFTTDMTTWWPLAEPHSIFGSDTAGVMFEGSAGGRIYEFTHDGREGSWGVVQVWEPPNCVVFSWNPNPDRDDSKSTEIEVRFVASAEGCAVTLEHRAWERLGEEAIRLRPGYEQGWPIVLARYVASAS